MPSSSHAVRHRDQSPAMPRRHRHIGFALSTAICQLPTISLSKRKGFRFPLVAPAIYPLPTIIHQLQSQVTNRSAVNLPSIILPSSFPIPGSSFLIPHPSFLILPSSFLIFHSPFPVPAPRPARSPLACANITRARPAFCRGFRAREKTLKKLRQTPLRPEGRFGILLTRCAAQGETPAGRGNDL